MKIIVVSDTHGNNKPFLEKAITIEKPDLIFHLGDFASDAKKISKIMGIDFIAVKGNGDHGIMDVNEDELIELSGKKIFLTHGHKYDVAYNLGDICHKGLELDADLILFGHTHMPIIEKTEDLIIMNPGSPSIPRSLDRKRTFGLITIGEEIEVELINIDE
jgi:putative phosphoesterase